MKTPAAHIVDPPHLAAAAAREAHVVDTKAEFDFHHPPRRSVQNE